MGAALQRALVQSAAISLVIFCILLLGQLAFPAMFKTPVEWWILLLLFAVAFVPRLIGLLVSLLPLKPGRRRKT
jgi:hypothetical protein